MDNQPAAGFPLTESQRRLWSLRQQGLAPRIACLVDLIGEFEPQLVRRAIEQVVLRHEMLRTGFLRRPGMRFPLQVPREAVAAGWLEVDLTEATTPAAGDRFEELWHRELVYAADREDDLLRAVLITRTGSCSLLISVPSLCADVFSLRRIVEEVAQVCAGGVEGLEDPVPYLDVVEWQGKLLTGNDEEATRGRAFWRRQDLGALQAPSLPFEGGSGPALREDRDVVPARVSVDTAYELRAELYTAAERHGVSRVEILRLAWRVLLARLSGESTFLLHELFDGRSDEQLLSMVGPLSRWIPQRVEEVEDHTLEEALRRVGRLHVDSEVWQHHLEWPAEANPAVDEAMVGFVVESWPRFSAGAGRALAVRRRQSWSEPFKLVLCCLELGEDLAVELHYDASRLSRPDVEHTAAQLAVLLAGLSSVEPRLRRLSLTGESESRVLAQLCRGEALRIPGQPVHRLIEAQAALIPLAPAVIYEDLVLSYGDLNTRANQLGRVLRRLGVTPDTPVALFVGRSPELMVGMLAILKAGGAYVPLDAAQPNRRLSMELDDLGVRVIVTENGLASRLSDFPGAVVRIDGDQEEISCEPRVDLERGSLPENLAYIIFTSGSTGRSKGVAVEHRQLLNYIEGIRTRLSLGTGWSYANVSTFAADLGNTTVFPALTSGGCLHLVAQERTADPAGMVEYFERHPVDCLKIVPTHLEALHAMAEPERLLPRRRLVLGGEASKVRHSEELSRIAGECRVFNHYGPSETTVGVLTYPVPTALDSRCRTLPIGSPLPNTSVYLLDREGKRVSVWEPGEIHIGGASVSRGYFGRPELTAESFVPDPFATELGMRMYRTGDLARLLPEGSIEFLGRRDHQVKFHGFRVELNEIRTLLNTHPQIRDSVVQAIRDRNGRDALIAYYVSRQELEFGSLRAWLAQRLAEVILPNFFVHLRKLPLTLNGKINYQALPGIEEAKQQARSSFIAPRTETEEEVARIWSEVLGIHPVGVGANFFELGGHSLLATRIISRLRERYQIDLPLRAIFDTPTVAALSRSVEARAASAAVPLAGMGAERSIEDDLAELEGITDEQAQILLEGAADHPQAIPAMKEAIHRLAALSSGEACASATGEIQDE